MPESRTKSKTNSPHQLDVVQQWFQAVITHPDGVEDGIESDQAQQRIHLTRDELEKVITRSKKLSAPERLSIYANAYYARLLECLAECFPILKRTVGEEVFNGFAFGYLQDYPSKSYTLGRLDEHFAQYLDDTRPDREDESAEPQDGDLPEANWPDFLIDLARLEWTINQVFDGPGNEKSQILTVEKLSQVPPDRWPDAKLVPAPCLRLVYFRFPVNGYFTEMRQSPDTPDTPDTPDAKEDEDGQGVEIPSPEDQYVAIHRKDYIVRRFELSKPQYLLLEALLDGQSVGEAIEAAADAIDIDDDQLAQALRQWFTDWASMGFFLEAKLDDR